MDLLQWVGLLGGAGGPISGIVIAVIANRRSKKENLADASNTSKNLEIKEQEADTHYWSALVEGFSDQLRGVSLLYNEANAKVTALEKKHAELEARLDKETVLKQEMLAHIIALENLVPNPPGPPRRPWV